MFGLVFRIILVRVRSDTLLVFKPNIDGANCPPFGTWSGFFKYVFKTSWTKGDSLFSWADKGQWEVTQTWDRKRFRESDWFRIGFAPVFVDYTKSGTSFAVIFLVEVSLFKVFRDYFLSLGDVFLCV